MNAGGNEREIVTFVKQLRWVVTVLRVVKPSIWWGADTSGGHQARTYPSRFGDHMVLQIYFRALHRRTRALCVEISSPPVDCFGFAWIASTRISFSRQTHKKVTHKKVSVALCQSVRLLQDLPLISQEAVFLSSMPGCLLDYTGTMNILSGGKKSVVPALLAQIFVPLLFLGKSYALARKEAPTMSQLNLIPGDQSASLGLPLLSLCLSFFPYAAIRNKSWIFHLWHPDPAELSGIPSPSEVWAHYDGAKG